jgi:hypothetical protein
MQKAGRKMKGRDISDVIHKARIEVDEEGALATKIGTVVTCRSGDGVKNYTIDAVNKRCTKKDKM